MKRDRAALDAKCTPVLIMREIMMKHNTATELFLARNFPYASGILVSSMMPQLGGATADAQFFEPCCSESTSKWLGDGVATSDKYHVMNAI
jgi:hypothetical protein